MDGDPEQTKSSSSIVALEEDGVAEVDDRKQAQRSGNAWQDRLGCGCNPDSRQGFTDIMKEGRICTDIPWLLAYFVVLIGLAAALYIPAFANGDADWILRGVDYNRRVCGSSSGVENRPLTIWPDTTNFDLKMCVADCNSTEETINVLSIDDGGIGTYRSSPIAEAWCVPTEDLLDDDDWHCRWKEVLVIIGAVAVIASLIGCCCAAASKTSKVPTLVASILVCAGGSVAIYFGVDCGDVFLTNSSSTVLSGYENFHSILTRQVAQLYTAMPVIAGSFGFAVVFGFIYVWLMEYAVTCIVWSGILLIISGGILLGTLFFWHVSTQDNQDSSTALAEQILGSLAYIATFIFICIVIWLRKRIAIACEVVKTSSRAVMDVKTLFVFPCCPILIGLLFALFWLYAQVYVFSTGDWITADMPDGLAGQENQFEVFPDTYRYLDLGEVADTTFWISLLLFLWTVNILIYWTYMVIAGTIADWYFTVRNEDGEKVRGDEINNLSQNPILSSMKRTTANHLGSIFYAAFIIAVIQLLRAIITYIQEMTDKAENPVTKCIFRCIKCGLWCIECCCRWIGKSGLVYISIFGDCFCESAFAAFQLQWRNLARVAMMTVVSRIVISVGQYAILAIPTGMAGLILMTMEPYKSDMSSITLPLFTICVLNYFVGWVFMEVYETAVDTVFLCFLIDEENNERTGLLADQGLRDIVEKYQPQSEEIALRRKSIMGNFNKEAVDLDMAPVETKNEEEPKDKAKDRSKEEVELVEEESDGNAYGP